MLLLFCSPFYSSFVLYSSLLLESKNESVDDFAELSSKFEENVFERPRGVKFSAD